MARKYRPKFKKNEEVIPRAKVSKRVKSEYMSRVPISIQLDNSDSMFG